jgi:cyclophilin family peptidyl-prolyl cis-trans isomerase
MGTKKRERQKQQREARLTAAHEAAVSAKRRQRIYTYGTIAAVLIVVIIGAAFLLSDDDPAPDTAESADTGAADGTEGAESVPCPPLDGSAEQILEFAAPQQMCIDPTAVYTAEVSTTKGDFTIELDATAAPETVNNFIVLSAYHYYDDVAFHRIIPDFMIQGGDPVGEPAGTGTPGYQIDDELPADPLDNGMFYEVGSVAMGNRGANTNTNGSQFFVVTGPNGEALPGAYSRFGDVTEGMDTVTAIEAVGSPDGAPSEDVRISSIKISGPS